MNRLAYLSQISIFEAMPLEELLEMDRLKAIDHFRHVPAHTVVQTPETEREGLFFVKEGKLRLYKLHPDGRQFTLGILSKGNLFGELESFSLGTRRVYIETMEPSFLCSMTDAQLERVLLSRPRLALKLLKALSDQLKERDDRLEQLAFSDLRGRVIHLLTTLAARFGAAGDDGYVAIDLRLSHQEIANMLGATREAVSVVMRELVKEGRIRTGRMSVALALEAGPELALQPQSQDADG
ncbi:Crp/Fnr family transcriptional regulator [Paenibacillus athensensis]|uniref:Crp/Fnr family transcriptional regulator n=1 Tax=Paenibacillus athensensis TaxID=1967502 RepID=UPI001431675D|nr:Crp/Fnr family transcriptional regulator [Paenibacillus athensensis]MCD1258976.1 Crp/Fnr family transcriptional regulator [Paenibacillus athensensis]